MLATLTKADQRHRAERVLSLTTRAINTAFNAYVTNASKVPANVMELLAQGKVEDVLAIVDRHIQQFGNSLSASFVDVGSAEVANFTRTLLAKARPTVHATFDATDPKAAELMRRNRLRLVTGLSQQQRIATRTVLVAGLQQGLSPIAMARQFRNSIGLTSHQLQMVASYERALSAGSVDALQRELRDRRSDPLVARAIEADEVSDVLAPNQIEMMTSRYKDNMIRMRADTISRTESLKVVGDVQLVALHQSLDQTGTSEALVGKTWNATLDSRTRDAHSERGGQRRRLDEPFAQGIMKPGDGGPEEICNCRCVLTYEFFHTPGQLADWLTGA